MHEHWSAFTLRAMQHAGWTHGRDVGTRIETWRTRLAESNFVMFPAAERALREFGGLRVDEDGPGRDCGRLPFRIDPDEGIGEDDRFAPFEVALGERLFPLGVVCDGEAFLAIAEDGRVFLVTDEIWGIATSISSAIDCLVEGYREGPKVHYYAGDLPQKC